MYFFLRIMYNRSNKQEIKYEVDMFFDSKI